MRYGIDVSFHKGYPDWSKAKEDVDFAILAVTERYKGLDWTFEHNYKGCVENGIKVGAYSYSYATSGEDSRRWAEMVVKALDGRKLDFPFFLDLEWEEQEKYPQSRINDIILQFREVILKAGYEFGIYCNKDWYYQRIPDFAKEYPLWLSWPAVEGNEYPDKLKPNYKNMTIWQYSFTGRVPGFGNQDIDRDVWYDDSKEEKMDTVVIVPGISANDIIKLAVSELGKNQFDLSHKSIIDTYNAHAPLARGYRVTYTDSWCDTFVSYLFIKAGAVDIIGGTECGVEEHVKKFIAAGIWNEDGAVVPAPGDIIVFNWNDTTQPNDGYSDHIGIVEYVEGNIIHTIEGNANGAVKRRTYRVGEGVIRGYARPKYKSNSYSYTETVPEPSGSPQKPSVSDSEGTLAPSPSVASKSPYDRPELALGSVGEAVTDLQKALNTLWAMGLVEDGIFGNMTQKAVRYTQEKMGLEIDGIVGPQTWRSIINRLMAMLVLTGAYGNGQERKDKLTREGYDYQAVQDAVNKILAL